MFSNEYLRRKYENETKQQQHIIRLAHFARACLFVVGLAMQLNIASCVKLSCLVCYSLVLDQRDDVTVSHVYVVSSIMF